MTTKRVTNSQAIKCITDREDFTNGGGSFRGENVYEYPSRAGQLPGWAFLALSTADPDYIVYSYSTPIAWHGKDGWVVPDVRYSVTTSKHQSIVLRAV